MCLDQQEMTPEEVLEAVLAAPDSSDSESDAPAAVKKKHIVCHYQCIFPFEKKTKQYEVFPLHTFIYRFLYIFILYMTWP